MFDALHPTKREMMSYGDYLKFALDLNCARPNDAPAVRCPVCRRAMKARAGQTKADGHFYHDDSIFCPTKDPASRPYLKLTPTCQDAAVIQENRKFGMANLELIYARLKSIAPYLDFKEFIEILKEAKRLNIYGYANLIATDLPYVYVTLINFLPSASYQKIRKLKFCFFYEEKIHSFEELWIKKGFSSDLFRISYRNGATQKVTKIDTTTGYLSEPPATMTDKQKKWCYDVL
ncbi:hypothetical protein [Xanthomonas arboricola]|uniref:Uncharacterized protein n=3 Tax=Xanthomonas arboricola pv. pruni TaxID=69929 RepID=A0AAQ0W2J8_9XANT|nr:hypothetical protein [Xanthomonas arboricola]GAE56555.1 hypothetical protein XPR_3190 [Xanthomonas arboricola pv. pruni MAFF 301420]KCX00217.1 hypothetical protein DK27_19415 [Xanthomonas arboricola pv. pruni]KPN11475.1 hypothetical protein AN652_05885 [Xanthomonas arboricola pv. pruni]MDN0265263.1 hypothetical protein [Xanthomonas arboricola pv. pruni]MDN0269130.1 hypothetical protein [Xanthomonas arboricola pv. pruni]